MPEADDLPTFPTAPPERLDLGNGVVLVRWRPALAPAAAVGINASLDHLRPWMAWAAEPATEDGLTVFFAEAEEQWDQCKDFGYSMVDDVGAVVGGCGLHGRIGRQGLEIGYWVHVDHAGRGLATAASRALTEAAFGIEGIERVKIQCAQTNVRSARVPEKLGYTCEGVTVPEDGPCEGRATQIWTVSRAHWMAGRHHIAP